MSSTTVINLRGRMTEALADPNVVYVGRTGHYGKQWLVGNGFGNPFRAGRDGTREEVIERFRQHVLSHPQLLDRVRRELRGKTLACWCHPLPCHADVLAELAESGPAPIGTSGGLFQPTEGSVTAADGQQHVVELNADATNDREGR